MPWLELDMREDPDEPRYVGDPSDLIDLASTLAELEVRPAWMADALCREHPDVRFFVERGEDVRPAKAVCDACLVRAECLAYAIEAGSTLHGIWGGVSDRERGRLRQTAA